jgi:hypothetical protein
LVFNNNNTVNCAFCRSKICEQNNKQDDIFEYSLSGQRDEYSLDRTESEDFIPVGELNEVVVLTRNLNI